MFQRRSNGRHKYSAMKSKVTGRSFPSKLEAVSYLWHKAREQKGEISNLKCQVEVRLTKAGIIYKPDFSWIDAKDGQVHFGETKGFETPEWRIKKRLWKYYGPGPLHIITGTATNFRVSEVIIPVHDGESE